MASKSNQAPLEKLFLEELRDIYDAEKQLTKALPKLAKKASNPDLQAGIEAHLEETESQVARIEKVFEMMGTAARGKKCRGVQGLLEEGEESIEEQDEPELKDAVLIASAQKVEHYEIAAYGTLCAWAKLLGMDEAVKLLSQTLEEEKAADGELSRIAGMKVNRQAA